MEVNPEDLEGEAQSGGYRWGTMCAPGTYPGVVLATEEKSLPVDGVHRQVLVATCGFDTSDGGVRTDVTCWPGAPLRTFLAAMAPGRDPTKVITAKMSIDISGFVGRKLRARLYVEKSKDDRYSDRMKATDVLPPADGAATTPAPAPRTVTTQAKSGAGYGPAAATQRQASPFGASPRSATKPEDEDLPF